MTEVLGTAGIVPPERAVRLLRAKAAELEAVVRSTEGTPPAEAALILLAADLALIAQLLADHIERTG